MKSHKRTGLIALSILIVLAIVSPYLLFQVQDSYRMGKTWQGVRNGLDIAALYLSYDTLRNRMEGFAEGMATDAEYSVTETDYQVSDEQRDMVDRVLSQDWVDVVQNVYVMLPVKGWQSYNIDKCKKYVIYNAAYDEGIVEIAFLLWYLEIETGDGCTMQLLVDAETSQIYYLSCVQPNVLQTWEELGIALAYVPEKKLNNTLGEWLLQSMGEQLYYWRGYYEAGGNTQESYAEYDAKSYTDVVSTVDNAAAVDSTVDDDATVCLNNLSFGEYSLTWEIGAQLTEEGALNSRFGIAELKEFIPEIAF